MGVAALRGLPWVARGLAGVGIGRTGARMALSVAVGIGLVAVFVPLLASADAAFAQVVDGWVPALDNDAAIAQRSCPGSGPR